MVRMSGCAAAAAAAGSGRKAMQEGEEEEEAAERLRSVAECEVEGREKATVVADLEGTLTRSRSSFPYYMLMALEGGSIVRAMALMLVAAPAAWALRRLCGAEGAAERVMVFAAMAGLKLKDIEGVARAVLPRFYAEDVRADAWRVFAACGGRRCVVAGCASRVMAEFFCRNHLGADAVLGAELQLTRGGRATGLLLPPGPLLGAAKRNAVKAALCAAARPDIGLGDRTSDLPFLRLCKEAYMVRSGGGGGGGKQEEEEEAVPMHRLFKPVVFHDGRLVRRPTPLVALLTLLWFPIGLALALLRVAVCVNTPLPYVPLMYKMLGIGLTVKGNVPRPAAKKDGGGGGGERDGGAEKDGDGDGVLFVCCHRTCLDPVFLSVALGRQVTAVTYSLSRVTEIISPIPTVRLTRDREKDARDIRTLLRRGNLVICPEGTTCREPVLLRFSALFAELTDRIVPVAALPKVGMFYGNTVRGFKAFDVFFFLMNPFPAYELTFLDQLPPALTHGAGGRPAIDVANHIQKLLAATLGFECTTFTRRDKYIMLTQGDGSVKPSSRAAAAAALPPTKP